jgi:hypothetical protein
VLVITDVLNCGNDVLLVKAEVDGQVYEARGWVSAIENHYDDSAYDDDGNRAASAKRRAMTSAEVGDYALRLLLEAHPELAARVKNAPDAIKTATPPATSAIAFEAPELELDPIDVPAEVVAVPDVVARPKVP